MKKIYLLLMVLGFYAGLKAQIVPGGAFIQGNYVEIGIDSLGGFEGLSWNSSAPPVMGAHYRSGNPYFGFVANPQMDGWVNYNGDFFTPGSPENGWGFEAIVGASDIKASNNCNALHQIPGSITSYNYSGGLHTVIWEGSFLGSGADLNFTIEYNLYDTAMAYTTTVTIENIGAPIDEFYYYRNLDPDNNEPISMDFSTTNTISAQASSASPYCSVKAEQSLPWYSVCSISATDSMARVSHGGFSNRDGSDIWNATGGLAGTVGSLTADEAISIACKVDSLTFGRAAHSFTFTTSFVGEGVVTNIGDQHTDGLSIYPNPTNGILNIKSADPVQSVMVYNAVGVLQFQSQNMSTVDLSGYANGIYLVKVKTGGETITKKIMKN